VGGHEIGKNTKNGGNDRGLSETIEKNTKATLTIGWGGSSREEPTRQDTGYGEAKTEGESEERTVAKSVE